jgi:hypothetical protein
MQNDTTGGTAGESNTLTSGPVSPAATMDAVKKHRLADALPNDPVIQERYLQADSVSHEQTAHGLPHAINVGDELVPTITGYVQQEYPGLVSDDEAALARIAGLLHDNGRAEEIKRHGYFGARWANRFLQTFAIPGDNEALPNSDRKRVVKAIACHSFGDFIRVKKHDVVLDLLYIADKCAGDETRVREDRAALLRRLARFSVRIPFTNKWLRITGYADNKRPGGEHDRVNFAVKATSVVKDERALVLRLTIDPRVCDPSMMWTVKWNRTAYQGCWIAAKRLGFEFQLEINGVRYRSNGAEADWQRVS